VMDTTVRPSIGRYDVLRYIRGQVGSANAWLTSAEMAKHFCTTSEHIAKLISILHKDGAVLRRDRAGTCAREYMASKEGKETVLPETRQRARRVDIATPADGAVAMRKEAAPAPVLPDSASQAKGQVQNPELALTLADVLKKHSKARQEALLPSPVDVQAELAVIATHCAEDAAAEDEQEHAAEPDASDSIIAVANELTYVQELLERAKRPAPVFLDWSVKARLLQDLAAILPPNTGRWLRAIAQDIERAGA